ncbi:hypothetical protein ASE65_14060 [Sphingomonas sp. Leaf16]|nr:hypothetical protein ASE65_14060 [Sphingomonas sp. Leaf16]KQN09353.1 hypothetical protein ASE81_14105 [Sphingomonas sp. Leaf29]KQN17531.1 hypothetical protein ASE83_14040 [Sphingomonas sp. Leaf32]
MGLASAGMMALLLAVPAAALPKDFKAQADAIVAASAAADGPGIQVAVSEHARIVYTAERGMADIAARRPITVATEFRIGSITKQFASAVLLQMVAEGKVALDDPLAKFLPTFLGGKGITVRQLLNHTSGIQSYTDIPGWMVVANTARPYSTEQLIAVFKDLPPVKKPGEAWSYNNSGYVLVGAIIEAVAKRPWHEEVARRLAGPNRLASIRYGKDPAVGPAMATGYAGADAKAPVGQAIDMSVPAAAGALVGTASDLTRWDDALHRGKVLTAPIYAQMIAPTRMPDGSTAPYGFGLIPGKVRGLASVGHSGGIFGFLSDTLYLSGPDISVAVLVNSDEPQSGPGAVSRKLAALAAGKPYPVFTPQPLDKAAVEPFLGTYTLRGEDRVLKVEKDELIWQRTDGRTTLIPVGDGRYTMGKAGLSWIVLSRDAAGKPQVALFDDGENIDGTLARTGPVPVEAAAVDVPAATLARYVGTYTAPTGRVTVAQGTSGLTVQLTGQPALALRPVSTTEFAVEKVEARVRFVEEGGRIVRLEIVQGGQTLPATRD